MTHVLIIEDDDDLRSVLSGVLESAGYSVTEAEEGLAALKAASAAQPDIVITDIIMEGMEGIALIMALRKTLKDVPILAMSGNAMYLDNSEKLGANAALLKPFTRETLLDAVEGLLTQSGGYGGAGTRATLPA
jgi:CheY-like chemotaxis protein